MIRNRNLLKTKKICYHHFISYNSQRNFGLRDRFKKWRANSQESQNKKTWLGEARRFLEFEDYNLFTFQEHVRLTVESNDKVGWGKRMLRKGLAYMNPNAYDYQQNMVDESRQLLTILDTFPKETFNSDPNLYFKNLNASILGIDIKMHTSQIKTVMERFQNNQSIHKLLKEKTIKGEDIPPSADALHEELKSPEELEPNMAEQQAFAQSNPYKKNGAEIYQKKIFDHMEKVWDSPYRRRDDYDKKAPMIQYFDWRLYGPNSYSIHNDLNKYYDNGIKCDSKDIRPNLKYRYSWNLPKRKTIKGIFYEPSIKPDIIRRDLRQKKAELNENSKQKSTVLNDSRFKSYYN